MMPASKHGDPQLGVDIHMCSTPVPTPLPTPHMSVVFDPFDYIPILGATITVCGMKRATAGTSGIAVHIPPGFPFAPMLPQKDDELFMGSATVVADGDPFSYIALPVLSCQVAGMPSIPRPRKKGPKKMMLGPLVFNLAIPTNVFIGGPPTISLMGMAMKGAFAGLGKLAKSGVFKRMRQKLFKNMKPGFLKCTVLRAEPVNILSGAVSVEHQDFVLPGRIPIEWRRVYGSDNPRAGHCGYGWETPADGRLEIHHDGVVMQYPGVGPLYFHGLPVAEGDAAAELELQDGAVLTDVDGEYRVRTKEDRIYHFPKRLMARRPEGGQSIALSKIADLCGNHLQFERHSGVLVAIHESAGRRLELRVDGGRIMRIGLVTPESPDRHVYVRYDYDAAGDLVGVRDALDHPYTFAYEAHHMVRHTDRNGLSFYYEYAGAADERRVVHAWGDGGLYDYRFEYSDVLNERRITDSLGHVSVVKLNEQGLPINEIDALNGVTIYEYDAAGRTVGVTDPDGFRTGYEYDERGNLLKLTRADGSSVESKFNALNKATQIVGPSGAKWLQSWDSRGLLLEHTTHSGHASRFEYDSHGLLTATIDPCAARTELCYDVYGQLVRVSNALGHKTRFGYDVMGNVTGKLDALGGKSLYRYDSKGRLVALQLPSGAQVHCEYDAEDNLTRHVDANGAATHFQYFGQGAVARRIQPDGHEVTYLYDTEEQLVGVRNQRGETYRLERDALGRIVDEVDYWGQSRASSYSPGGRLLETRDPAGRTIRYSTDPMGRVLRKAFAGSDASELTESFEYDSDGYLIAATNAQLRIERTVDPAGRLLEERQGEHFTIAYEYDAVGRRTLRRTRFEPVAGCQIQHQVEYGYDARGLLTKVRIDEHAPIEIERNALGQAILERLSPAVRRELEYGSAGDLVRQRALRAQQHILDVAYLYDAASNLIERRDAELGIDRFTYDPMQRLLQHIDPEGKLHSYLTDAAGDRLQTRVRADEHSASGYRSGVYDGAEYSFDRSGNLVRLDDPRGALLLTWDADQRLVASRRGDAVTSYQYDALGRRIEKRTGDAITRFAWDGDALVAEASMTAGQMNRSREWVYYANSFKPLAMLTDQAQGPSLLHYHNDPNGCPIRLTDAAGEVRWAASHTAWGGIRRLHSNAVDQPLRLQGQYEDVETGFCFNRFRYYCAPIGQYISSDPIGLNGGINLHAYAPNAMSWADPLGLKKKCETLVRYVSEAEAEAMRAANGLVPKMHGDVPSKGAKWISELGKERNPRDLGKASNYTHKVTIEVEEGTKEWLNDSSRKLDYEDMVGGESKNTGKILTKGNEPGSYGVGADLLPEFNSKVQKITVSKL